MGQAARRWALAALLLALALAATQLPIRSTIESSIGWLQGLGVWGPVLIAAAYTPACLLFIPGSWLTLAAGYAFGVVTGVIAISLGSVVGATAAFLAGRTIARPWIESKVRSDPRFAALDGAVGSRGFRIVLLTRLSPAIPFNVLNYALGVTSVRLRDYVLASWIGMFPGTVMYVYLGATARSFADLTGGQSHRSTAQTVLFAVGLVATVLVTAYMTRVARRALREAAPADASTSLDPSSSRKGALLVGPAAEATETP